MDDEVSRRQIIDDEHVRLLALGYQISAGLSALFSLFGLMYAGMGFAMGALVARMPGPNAQQQAPPAFIGWLFAGLGLFMFATMVVMALLKLRVASCLKRHTSRTFCLVIGGISCLGIPYGLILGAFTFLVLGRDSVIRQFHSARAQNFTPNVTHNV
jgi:hypothetical protein